MKIKFYFLIPFILGNNILASEDNETAPAVSSKHLCSEDLNPSQTTFKRQKKNPYPPSAISTSVLLAIDTLILPQVTPLRPTPSKTLDNQQGSQNGISLQGASIASVFNIVELKMHIFSYLPLKEFLNIKCVCRGWRQSAEEQLAYCFVQNLRQPCTLNSNSLPLYFFRYPYYIENDLLNAVQTLAKQVEDIQQNALARALNDQLIIHGNLPAIERKIEGLSGRKDGHIKVLAKGKYGYVLDLKAASILNDELCKRGNRKALNLKAEGLIDGKHGYTKNMDEAILLEERLIAQDDREAIESKFERLYAPVRAHEVERQEAFELDMALSFIGKFGVSSSNKSSGKYGTGYFKAADALRNFNEELITKNYSLAIKRKIEGLANGCYGYQLNKDAARALNDGLVGQGDNRALWRKIEGLAYGMYGYIQDKAEAVALNESLILQGNKEAIKRKLGGLMNGRHGYEKNDQALRALNEAFIAQGDEEALACKIAWIAEGKHGYTKDEKAAINLNEKFVTKGNLRALKRKVDGLAYGCYGYTRNESTVRLLVEKMIEQNNSYAIQYKIWGLEEGKYGYKKNLSALNRFNEQLVAQHNLEAIKRKLTGLANGWYGYKKESTSLKSFIEKMLEQVLSFTPSSNSEIHEILWRMRIIKTIGLTYGFYGYEKDVFAAIDFTQQHRVFPYLLPWASVP